MKKTIRLHQCKVIQLPKIRDKRGNIAFAQNDTELPFRLQRIYYLYDVPGGAVRGAHAHKQLQQVIIPVAGSFTVEIDDGSHKKEFFLNQADFGLYLCSMIWREIKDFSSGAVCLVLASEKYDPRDYIRSYADFKKYICK